MGQSMIFKGKTWRLGQALRLMDKDFLTGDEISAILEGGKLCTRQGANLLSCGREDSDVLKTVDALAVTSEVLMNRLKKELDPVHRPVSEESVRKLGGQIDEIDKESQYLFLWVRRLSEEPPEGRWDA